MSAFGITTTTTSLFFPFPISVTFRLTRASRLTAEEVVVVVEEDNNICLSLEYFIRKSVFND